MDMEKLVYGVIMGIVAVIVIFLLIGNTSGELADASENISGTGFPLANLFGSNGVVMMLFMVGILLAVIGIVMKFRHHK